VKGEERSQSAGTVCGKEGYRTGRKPLKGRTKKSPNFLGDPIKKKTSCCEEWTPPRERLNWPHRDGREKWGKRAGGRTEGPTQKERGTHPFLEPNSSAPAGKKTVQGDGEGMSS